VPPYDVFVSYRHADADAVRALAGALRLAGLAVWLDDGAIEAFASIQRSIEEGLARSKVLLAFYSARYPESLACQWELTRAFVAGQQEGDARRRVLLVNPEPSSTHIHPVELRDALYSARPNDPAALEAAAAAVAGHVQTLPGPIESIEGRPRPPWFGPARGDGSNRFFGRLSELWAIHSGLWSADLPIITGGQSRPLVRLTGMGGSGKSLAAEVYAIRFGAAYPGGIFWLRAFGHDADRPAGTAERQAALESALVDFAGELGIAAAGLSGSEVRQRLTEQMGARGPYLWVVDDLASGLSWDGIQPWLAPTPQGRTLITTRSEALSWAGAQVRLDDLDEPAALQLLTHARAPRDAAEEAEARQLAQELGRHALALELAAVAVQKRGYAEFRASLAAPSRDALDFAAQLLAEQGQALPHREKANLNLSTTLLQSVDVLDEAGRDVLRLASQLAPVAISRLLVVRALAAADRLDDAEAEDTADLALAGVIRESLAREIEPGSVLVHTLVTRAVRLHGQAPDRLARLRQGALRAVNGLLDERVTDVRRYPEIRDVIEHARALVGGALAEERPLALSEAQVIDGLYLCEFNRGNYPSARRAAERLIEFSRRTAGDEHPSTLTVMSYLGEVLRAQGDYTGSLAVHQRVFEARRRSLGETNAATLRSLSDASLALYAQGELRQARELQERILEQRLRLLGPDHPETVTSMNNLAATLTGQGHLDRARELQESVLRARQAGLGSDHDATVQSMVNLAETLRAQGDLARARELQEEAVARGRQLLGERHPDTLLAMNNLAATLAALGDLAGAQAVQEQVIAGRRQALGEDHLLTLASLRNLAAIHLEQGRPAEARRILEASLERCRAALGPDHTETLSSAYHLVVALARMVGTGEAIKTLVQRDLRPVLGRAPEDLPGELKEVQRHLALILGTQGGAAGGGANRWWRKLIGKR